MERSFEASIRPVFVFKLAAEDGVVSTYKLFFPLPAIIAAEVSIGRPLLRFSDWDELTIKELPAVVFVGLQQEHPDITREDVDRMFSLLTPEAMARLRYELIKLNFPQTVEMLEKIYEEAAKKKGEVEVVGELPNVKRGES